MEVGLQLPLYSVDEGGDFVTVCVEIERGELARDVDVHLDTVDETATRDRTFIKYCAQLYDVFSDTVMQ